MLEKTYVKVVPTVVLWDGVSETSPVEAKEGGDVNDDGNDDDVWDTMQAADSDEDTGKHKRSRAK